MKNRKMPIIGFADLFFLDLLKRKEGNLCLIGRENFKK